MTTMFFEKHICAVDTEARENLRARDSKFYQMLSAAVVAPDGVKLHLPVKPMGVELEDIDSTFNNLPFPPEVLYHAPRPSEVRNMIKAMVRGCNVLVWNAEHEEQHLPFLASVGSTSPYIGLLGTVWGIMHSFRGLANATQATLATVAPGISEALIATAMGLFAAIPAVLAYNRLAARSDALLNRYETFLDEFSGILQRQTYALKAHQTPRA